MPAATFLVLSRLALVGQHRLERRARRFALASDLLLYGPSVAVFAGVGYAAGAWRTASPGLADGVLVAVAVVTGAAGSFLASLLTQHHADRLNRHKLFATRCRVAALAGTAVLDMPVAVLADDLLRRVYRIDEHLTPPALRDLVDVLADDWHNPNEPLRVLVATAQGLLM